MTSRKYRLQVVGANNKAQIGTSFKMQMLYLLNSTFAAVYSAHREAIPYNQHPYRTCTVHNRLHDPSFSRVDTVKKTSTGSVSRHGDDTTDHEAVVPCYWLSVPAGRRCSPFMMQCLTDGRPARGWIETRYRDGRGRGKRLLETVGNDSKRSGAVKCGRRWGRRRGRRRMEKVGDRRCRCQTHHRRQDSPEVIFTKNSSPAAIIFRWAIIFTGVG